MGKAVELFSAVYSDQMPDMKKNVPEVIVVSYSRGQTGSDVALPVSDAFALFLAVVNNVQKCFSANDFSFLSSENLHFILRNGLFALMVT